MRSRGQQKGNIKDKVWKTEGNSYTNVKKKSLSGRKMVSIGSERFEVVIKFVCNQVEIQSWCARTRDEDQEPPKQE